MKAQLPRPEHYSYRLHRKQRTTQIILPIVLSTVIFLGITILVCVAALNANGNISTWAEISTIWLTIPMIIGGLIFLAILVGLIYLMVGVLTNLPYYTSMAQDYINYKGSLSWADRVENSNGVSHQLGSTTHSHLAL